MSKKLLLRIAIAVPLLLVTCESADAASRRALRRAARYSLYQRFYQAQPVCQSGIQPTNAKSSGKREQNYAFPDICPNTPLFQDSEGRWVWYAERYYGVGMNCDNCYIEPTTLVGDYGIDTYAWPYPCGHEMCEPGYHMQPPPDYSGQKQGLIVDFDFNPIGEMPVKVRDQVQEVFPRRYYSFKDQGPAFKTRYFIAYHIKTPRSQFTFGHEVDRSILEGRGVTIHPLTDKQVTPIKHEPGVQSYVYQYKESGNGKQPEPPALAIFFLKK